MNLGGAERGVSHQKTLYEILKELIQMREKKTEGGSRRALVRISAAIFAGRQGLWQRKQGSCTGDSSPPSSWWTAGQLHTGLSPRKTGYRPRDPSLPHSTPSSFPSPCSPTCLLILSYYLRCWIWVGTLPAAPENDVSPRSLSRLGLGHGRLHGEGQFFWHLSDWVSLIQNAWE